MTSVISQELAKLIEQEVQLMSTLLDVLKNEELVLVENTPEKLETVITEKNALLVEIISLEKQRNQLLTQAGFALDTAGIKAFLDSTPPETRLQEKWENLIALSADAKENNRTNGLLINRQMARNQSTLNILQQNDSSSSVYGADGQSRTNIGGGRGIVAG